MSVIIDMDQVLFYASLGLLTLLTTFPFLNRDIQILVPRHIWLAITFYDATTLLCRGFCSPIQPNLVVLSVAMLGTWSFQWLQLVREMEATDVNQGNTRPTTSVPKFTVSRPQRVQSNPNPWRITTLSPNSIVRADGVTIPTGATPYFRPQKDNSKWSNLRSRSEGEKSEGKAKD